MKILRVSTVVHHFRAQFRLPSAAASRYPLAAKVANLTGWRAARQFRQHSGKNGFIPWPVMGRAESATHGVVDKNRARRGDFTHDVECRANHQRGNALAFDNVSDETDGLVAKGSIGDEEGEIDFGLH